jgi:hypothetical protein
VPERARFQENRQALFSPDAVSQGKAYFLFENTFQIELGDYAFVQFFEFGLAFSRQDRRRGEGAMLQGWG